jgi:hypothetical protein
LDDFQMRPEAQRIAIAEVCGWKICLSDLQSGLDVYKGETATERRCVPDYLSDLNAMHEAERYACEHLMDADQWEQYGHELERVHPSACLKTPNEEIVDYYEFATLMTDLTAAQRAEAFLKTLGLWK